MPRVEALIFDAWNSLPDCPSEVKKLAFGVLTIFGSTYSCDHEYGFDSTGINKSCIDSEGLHLIRDFLMNVEDDGLYADFWSSTSFHKMVILFDSLMYK
ncbi:hypothetical protein TNCV_2586121 [Trichonephila clavipes]|nr:hypothetical protein TNCV_2586121 [Trichonephila clavipes]